VHRADICFGRAQARVCQQSFQPALPSARLVVVLSAQKAADIVLLLFDIFILGFKFRQAAGVARFPLGQIGGVIAAVHFQGRRHFPDLRSGLVQKVAVVGDDNHRAVPVPQPGFQPLHRGDIQMVAGLIQQQQVRFFQEQTCQHGPSALPAGKLDERALVVRFQEAESRKSLLDAVGVGITAALFKARQHSSITLQHVGRAVGVLHLALEDF